MVSLNRTLTNKPNLGVKKAKTALLNPTFTEWVETSVTRWPCQGIIQARKIVTSLHNVLVDYLSRAGDVESGAKYAHLHLLNRVFQPLFTLQ